MPRKPNPKPDDPAQSKRFVAAARAAGTDESPEAFERVFRKVVGTTRAPDNAQPSSRTKRAR